MSDLPDDLIRDLQSFDQRMRDEIRADAHEEEGLVADAELRNQTFADALLELVNRGDTVQLITPRRTFLGQLVYVGRDFVTVKDPESTIDVNLAQSCVVHVVVRAKEGGKAKGQGPGSFEMRMYEHKMDMADIEIHTASMEEGVKGKISVVGQDHLLVVDAHKESWLFPLSTVHFVIRRPDTQRR